MMLESFRSWEAVVRHTALYVVPACAYAVLTAVAINFVLARRDVETEERRPSPIATLSMLLFFFGLYEIIHWRLGVWKTQNPFVLLPMECVGLGLVVLGAAVNIAGRFHLGGNWANQATVYRDQGLITTGLYGVVRHPLYASLIAMGVGASMAFRNWVGLVAVLLIFRTAMAQRAELEEQMLEERFPEYGPYKSRVGRFFPKCIGCETALAFRPIEVPRAAFAFCRWSMAGVIWIGVMLHLQPLLGLCAVVMAVSAILTVRRAPMVMLYSAVVETFRPSEKIVVDATGLRLAHVVAAVGLAGSLAYLQWGEAGQAVVAWRFLYFLALFKTAGAMGFCAVSRMFTCMVGGGSCCRFMRVKRA